MNKNGSEAFDTLREAGLLASGDIGLDVPPPRASWTGPSPASAAGTAGGRARAEYARRRANDKATFRAMLPFNLVLLVLAWPAGYLLARFGISILYPAIFDGNAMPASQAQDMAVLAGLALLLGQATSMVARKTSTEAFRIGAVGEERVGSVLDSLWRRGYVAIHDIPTRGWGNIDHVLVGPGGIYTIETKNSSGTVKIERGSIRQAGRDRSGDIEQALRQAEIVRSALASDPALGGLPVIPIVCYAKAPVESGFFSSGTVGGVRVFNPCDLKRIAKAPARLNAVQVSNAADLLTGAARAASGRGRAVPRESYPIPAPIGGGVTARGIAARLSRKALFIVLQIAVVAGGLVAISKIMTSFSDSMVEHLKPSPRPSAGAPANPGSSPPACDLNALKPPCVYRPGPSR